jgi:hypothetical protein
VSAFRELETVRHQVAITGSVTDAQTGGAIGQARVEIKKGPAAFTDRLALQAMQHEARWATMEERADRTRTRADGHFYFLEDHLPDGDYTLQASLPGSGTRYASVKVEVSVSRDDQGKITRRRATIYLPSTAVNGQITDRANGDPVVMAEVRVKGSGERAFSDKGGQYELTGLEAGVRTLTASAQGYQPVSRDTKLGEAGAVQTLDFDLFPAKIPTSIPGCRLWLQAEAISGLNDNDPVSAWPNISGQDQEAKQDTPAAQPRFMTRVMFRRPVARFDGVDDFLRLRLAEQPAEQSTDHTFFFVCDLKNLGGHDNYLFDASHRRLTLEGATQNPPHQIGWRDSAWHHIAGAIPGRQVLTWVFMGTKGEVFRNGMSLGSDTYEPTSLGGQTAVGANSAGDGSHYEGDLAEFIYYNRALPAAERQRVERYLSNRYAI